MKSFLATAISIVAATNAVSAWEITAYEAGGDCQANNQRYRNLIGENGDCLTFGQDFPGVDCVQYNNGGADMSGCVGEFTAKSLLLQPGVICEVYSAPFCGDGQLVISTAQGDSTSCSALLNADPIGSIKCS
ncbi:hypothetical protein FDECE_10318 [Fusarium decemcellulare]|nr:hypothetical protein FDECE_10318 [Fusarium decemcellulare]